MLLLALTLASVLSAGGSTLSVKVVSLEFSYPYFGEPGNRCQGSGNVFVRAVTSEGTAVVVRIADSAGLSPGKEAVLGDVRRAGSGRDGTAVFCAAGRVVEAAPVAQVAAPAPAPVSAPAPVAPVAAEPAPATESRCTVQLFNIVKRPLGANKFGPSEFDPELPLNVPEPVECALARSRNTNVLLVRMVKDGSAKPASVIGAEWEPGSKWEKVADARQRRVVRVYFDGEAR
ncbi:MAG: hypothetical protein ACOZQL_20740 [Myxococcota bacterium]